MNNVLILGKYAPATVLTQLVEAAAGQKATIRIIEKEGDEVTDNPLIVRHQRNMLGDVCDLLWEAAKLDQSLPLVIASVRGFMHAEKAAEEMVEAPQADLLISCTESAYAGFKFDAEGTVCESADLPASTPYVVVFKRTADFTKAAEEIILHHKSEKDGKFELRTVVNQMILQGAKISAVPADFGD